LHVLMSQNVSVDDSSELLYLKLHGFIVSKWLNYFREYYIWMREYVFSIISPLYRLAPCTLAALH